MPPSSTNTTHTWQGQSRALPSTLAIGEAVGRIARTGDLIALIGELGAGKTQFVRGLARGLGGDERCVSSPTFVLVQEYEGGADRPALIHLDAYRLNSFDDLASIGWDVVGQDSDNDWRQQAVVAIEWADRFEELVGDDYLEVQLAHGNTDDDRDVTITAKGRWAERWADLTEQLRRATHNSQNDLSSKRPSTMSLKCPICKKAIDKDGDAFPFCSNRCRTIDLGRWADESYRISRPIEQADLDEE